MKSVRSVWVRKRIPETVQEPRHPIELFSSLFVSYKFLIGEINVITEGVFFHPFITNIKKDTFCNLSSEDCDIKMFFFSGRCSRPVSASAMHSGRSWDL